MEELAKKTESYLNMLQQQFLEHPNSQNLTYTQHMSHAMEYGLQSLISGGVFITHAVFPFLFEHTGSEMIKNLHEKLSSRQTTPTNDNTEL